MKIFKSIASGALRALRSWKFLIIIWLVSLLLVSLYIIPMKGIMKAGFGNSTATEMLRNGINIDVLSDLNHYFSSLLAYFSSGLIIFIFVGIAVNSFLAGGLFKSLKDSGETLSIPCFFRASAKYFWYFFGLYFLINLFIILTGLLIIALPVGLVAQAENAAAGLTTKVGIVAASIFLMIMFIFFLVCDYSRAWLVSSDKPAFFKALGFGFSQTFSRFWSSFPMMLIIMVVMVLFAWLFSTITGAMKPETGGGLILLFLVSQLLVLVKILLKAWRYGSVTSLMELNKSQ